MNFDFNDEQREIKSTAREFLASRFKPEKVRELAESDSPYDDGLWKRDLRARLARDRASPRSTAARASARSRLVILAEEMGYALRALAVDLERSRRAS